MKKRQKLLTDEQWELIEPLLPQPRVRRDRRGRPWASNRACFEGMLMRMPSSFSRPVKAWLVNWLPWSVLKISGFPFPRRASSKASRQNETSMVIDSRQLSTRRLNQSTTAARYGKQKAPNELALTQGPMKEEQIVYISRST